MTQIITDWQPPTRLKFKMVSTDQAWGRWVQSLEEVFTLEPLAMGTRITRTTVLAARGPFRLLTEILFSIGLKRVHLFVFKNWRIQAGG